MRPLNDALGHFSPECTKQKQLAQISRMSCVETKAQAFPEKKSKKISVANYCYFGLSEAIRILFSLSLVNQYGLESREDKFSLLYQHPISPWWWETQGEIRTITRPRLGKVTWFIWIIASIAVSITLAFYESSCCSWVFCLRSHCSNIRPSMFFCTNSKFPP